MKIVLSFLLTLVFAPDLKTQHETKLWLNANAGWSILPDTGLGGVQLTVNPKKFLISGEFMFDESSISTGINTGVLSLTGGYVFNNPSSKLIYYGQPGLSSVSQYTVDCIGCDPYNRKKSVGAASELGISFRPFVKAPFGIGCKVISNLNKVENFADFSLCFSVIRF